MVYDNGETLQGLDEEWNFMGANAIEWGCGVMVFMIISTCSKSMVTAMPIMLLGMLTTAYTLASLRKMFPDEHKGVANLAATACGFPPIFIPPPAKLQPLWSAAPVRDLPSDCRFMKLGLLEVLNPKVPEADEVGEGKEG
jgi:hypothetical protein